MRYNGFSRKQDNPPKSEREDEEIKERDTNQLALLRDFDTEAHGRQAESHNDESENSKNTEKCDKRGENERGNACPVARAEKSCGNNGTEQARGGKKAQDREKIFVRKRLRKIRAGGEGKHSPKGDVRKTEQENRTGGDADGEGEFGHQGKCIAEGVRDWRNNFAKIGLTFAFFSPRVAVQKSTASSR